MPWLQAHLTVTKEQAPLIELLFENLGALSVTLLDAADEPMLEPAPGETPLWTNTRLTGLFDGGTNPDQLRSLIDQAMNTDASRQLELEVLEDQVWERVWLDHFQPIQFGNRLWICPTGKQVYADDPVVIRLDPGLAFGTGTHPTTALCLEWLDGANVQGKTLIDYGCGSGILAIAALKLGAERVIAVDHDPQAIIATNTNAKRNGVSNRLLAVSSNDFQSQHADIVIANILANILVELAPRISRLVNAEGELLLSGILHNQAPQVIAAYNEFSFAKPARKEDWVRLQGHRIQ
jgi:ribosomal protein L11 methyltransferase